MATNITIAKLNTLITANAVQFSKEILGAKAVAKGASDAINSAFAKIGGALSVGAVVAFGKSIIDLGSNITDLAREAGMSNQAFQTISAVAADSGVGMEQVAKASEHLRGKLQEAAAGAAPIRMELEKLNLTFSGLQSLAPERQWEAIAQHIYAAKDQQEAFNIAVDLFGEKSAPKLKEVLARLATEGFDKLADSTKNIKLTDEQLKSLDDAGDKLTRIATQLKVIGARTFLAFANDFWGTLGKANALMATPGGLGGLVHEAWTGGDGGNTGAWTKGWGPNGKLPTPVASLDDQMKQGSKDYALAHPFDSIRDENNKDKQTDSLLHEFFDKLDDKSKREGSSTPITVEFPQAAADRLSRIGLLTGKGALDEAKKQSTWLEKITAELRNINTNTKVAPTAVYN